jgi:hypothetical protein
MNERRPKFRNATFLNLQYRNVAFLNLQRLGEDAR